VVGENSNSQISLDLVVAEITVAFFAMCRHLDLVACTLPTWVRTAALLHTRSYAIMHRISVLL